MFHPKLYRADDPEVSTARARARGILERGAQSVHVNGSDERVAQIAAWSIVHGFTSLWESGSLPDDLGDTPEAAARRVIRLLFER